MAENQGFPGLVPDQKTAVFIEAADFFKSCHDLGFRPDMPRLREALASSCDLVHLVLYRAVMPGVALDVPLPSALDGYEVKTRVGQVITKVTYDPTARSNVFLNRDTGLDVKMDLAEDMIDISYEKSPDRMLLVSSASELASALAKIAKRGVKISLMASHRSITSAENPLYAAADDFISLSDVRSLIEERPKSAFFMPLSTSLSDHLSI